MENPGNAFRLESPRAFRKRINYRSRKTEKIGEFSGNSEFDEQSIKIAKPKSRKERKRKNKERVTKGVTTGV